VTRTTTVRTIRTARGQKLLNRWLVACTCGWGQVVRDAGRIPLWRKGHLKDVADPSEHTVIVGGEMGMWTEIEDTTEEEVEDE